MQYSAAEPINCQETHGSMHEAINSHNHCQRSLIQPQPGAGTMWHLSCQRFLGGSFPLHPVLAPLGTTCPVRVICDGGVRTAAGAAFVQTRSRERNLILGFFISYLLTLAAQLGMRVEGKSLGCCMVGAWGSRRCAVVWKSSSLQ